MIRLENISLVYKGSDAEIQALSNVNLTLKKGSSMSIIGPSGCGKSSLLFILAGLLKQSSGKAYIDGSEVGNNTSQVSLILQDYGLFQWKTVLENACLGLRIRGYSKKTQLEIVMPILEQLGLAPFVNRYPTQLSGGQRQRVAIARSLALTPDLLLMDEPLSSLDALTRENLQKFILDIWKQHKFTLVIVTHSIEEAVFLGKRIAVMSQRPGTILDIIDNSFAGSPQYRQKPEFHSMCSRIRKILGV